jgi:hypothetical protein
VSHVYSPASLSKMFASSYSASLSTVALCCILSPTILLASSLPFCPSLWWDGSGTSGHPVKVATTGRCSPSPVAAATSSSVSMPSMALTSPSSLALDQGGTSSLFSASNNSSSLFMALTGSLLSRLTDQYRDIL